MVFDPHAYGEDVERILALDGRGERLMPLAHGQCSSRAALAELNGASSHGWFARSRAPKAALAGLYLYFSCLNESHEISQSDSSVDGSFWHGIMHRQEPDPGNSAYWFRRVGGHPIFPALAAQAAEIARRHGVAVFDPWDPFAYIEMCEQACRDPGSVLESAALEIQRAEWQLLFHHCARSATVR